MSSSAEVRNDHELAGYLADHAGQALSRLKAEAIADAMDTWELRDRGDMLAHQILVDGLSEHRPGDAVLSEEGVDDPARLRADRTWIVDPLDGTQDFPFPDSAEWAVHVALVEAGKATAAAVAVPGMNWLCSTAMSAAPDLPPRPNPIVVSGRSNLGHAGAVARAVGGQLTACGSAGVKAALVVKGEADVYVHASGLYEWDVCAPAAVAEAAGLAVSDLEGNALTYNKVQPIVRGLVITRRHLLEAVSESLGW